MGTLAIATLGILATISTVINAIGIASDIES